MVADVCVCVMCGPKCALMRNLIRKEEKGGQGEEG